MARMRNCPRCKTSIGETLAVCPACDLPNPFVSPPDLPESDAPSSSSPSAPKKSIPHLPSLAAFGGWAGIAAFAVWNLVGAVALAFAIGNYSTFHCHDQNCTNGLVLAEIFTISLVVVVWLIGFVATGMLALLTGVNARRRRRAVLSGTEGSATPPASEFAISGLDDESTPRRLRKLTWAILAWTAFCALWLGGIAIGLIPALLVVSGDSVDSAVGGFLVFLLWSVVFFFLGIAWLMTQPSSDRPTPPPPPLKPGQIRCAHCHKIVKAGVESCTYCRRSLKPTSRPSPATGQEAEA